jgi:hypothetical protein
LTQNSMTFLHFEWSIGKDFVGTLNIPGSALLDLRSAIKSKGCALCQCYNFNISSLRTSIKGWCILIALQTVKDIIFWP